MSSSSEADPMEGIRDVFEAYKLLTQTNSKPYLSFVVKHLTTVFDGESPDPPGTMVSEESQALAKIRIIFQAYKKLSKWAPEDAEKILIAHLESVLDLKETSHKNSEPAQVTEEINVNDDTKIVSSDVNSPKVAPAIETTSGIVPTPSSSRTITFEEQSKEVPSSSSDPAVGVFTRVQSTNLEDLNSLRTSGSLNNEATTTMNEETDYSASLASGSVKSSNNNRPAATATASSNTSDESFYEIWRSVNASIQKEVEATLQKSGSPYILTSKRFAPFLCHVCKKRTFGCLDFLAAHIWSTHLNSPPDFNCPYPHCDLTYKHPGSLKRHVKKCKQGKQKRPCSTSGYATKKPEVRKLVIRKPEVGKSGIQKPEVGKSGIQKLEVRKSGIRKPGAEKLVTRKPEVGKPGIQKPVAEKLTFRKIGVGKLKFPKPGAGKLVIRKPEVGKSVIRKPEGGKPGAQKLTFRKIWVGKLKSSKPGPGKLENRLIEKGSPSQKVCMKKSLICSHCDKVYPSHSALRVHIAYYSAPKSLDCKYCGKSFRHQGGLAIHERIHTGEKPYECPFCQKLFSQAGNLKTHEQLHFSTRKYECQVCHKKFIQKGNFKRHERTSGCLKGLPLPSKS